MTNKKISSIYHEFKVRLAGSLLGLVAIALIAFFGLSFATTFLQRQITENRQQVSATLSFPDQPVRAEELTLATITFSDDNNDTFTAFTPSAGKYFHLFVTNEKLQMFGHDHPDTYDPDISNTIQDGQVTIPIMFPKAGTYSLALRFDTEFEKDISKLFTVSVQDENGAVIAQQQNPANDVTFDNRKTKVFNGYKISLSTEPQKISACSPALLTYTISKDNARIDQFAMQDNAVATIAAWDRTLQSFTYGTGTRAIDSEEASRITASITFPRTGDYQVFSEFEHQENTVPSSFYIRVEESRCESK